MKHLDLFSGIGGFALAASRVWKEDYINVGHCEIEEYACKVYHKHFPTSKCLGDITKVKWNEGQADIITGGFPCQPHSQAGKRLASKDERDLWYECKRAVSEIRPRYALFENVSGLLTSERGWFFNRVLSDLASIGYDAEWTNIPASEIGAPHRRNRIWILAHTDKESIVELVGKRIAEIQREKRTNKRSTYWSKFKLVAGRVAPEKWEHEGLGITTRPLLIRGGDGLSIELALGGYGNAIVPQVAEVILQAIKDTDQ